MTRRLLLTYLTLTAFVLVVLAAPLGILFARAERRHVADQVRHDALVLSLQAGQALQTGQAKNLPPLATSYQHSTGGRVTIVDATGLVLADSDPAQPGQRNFADRPEVAAALHGQENSGQRHSNTLGRDLFYAASPMVWRGQITGAVRIVYPPSLVNRRIVESWLLLGVVALAVLAVAALAGKLLAGSVNRLVRELEAAAARLARGELGARAAVPAGPGELRSLAAAFNHTAAELERLVGSQRAFVADASHQLRSPLAALRLRLENLEAEVPGAAQEDLDGAIAEVWRLSRLVDGLLALARAEQASAAPEPLCLATIAGDRCAAWSALAAERDVELVTAVPAPLGVLATPGHLEQVLDNLLANALEVAPLGTAVTVRAGRIGAWVELHVADQGPGMDAEQRARAFDRFWRSGRRSHSRGSGLGLAIVHQLVTGDGGTVSLHQARGGGLVVAVRLLSAPAPRPSQTAVPALPAPVGSASRRGTGN